MMMMMMMMMMKHELLFIFFFFNPLQYNLAVISEKLVFSGHD